ncbi:hypothetical protein QEN19_001737 [Hanseniaspora menglaensis]
MSLHISKSSPLYTTPLQFQTIEPNLYRGIYPTEENLYFLNTLNLKTIISILPEEFEIKNETPYYLDFIEKHYIVLHQFQGDMKWKKEKDKSSDKGKKNNEDKEKDKKLNGKKKEENVKRRDKTVGITVEEIYKIVEIVSDPLSYPIYIHDLTNETVTPLIVAIFRKLAYWNLVSIIEEFIKFSGSVNVHERKFIEEFPIKKIKLQKKFSTNEDSKNGKLNSMTNWIRRVGM